MNKLVTALQVYAGDPRAVDANLELAKIYHDLGQTAAAVSFYMRAAEISSDDDVSYACLIRTAQCFEAQGHRHVSVRSMAKRALVLQPQRPEAYWYLARFNETTSQYSDCYMLCRQAQQFCDFDAAPLPLDVGYPGPWAFDFERSIAAWWWGMNQESQALLRQLFRDHWQVMTDQYRRALLVNLRKTGNQQLFFEREYDISCAEPSDINQHLPVLRDLAQQCEHITEMGVRTGVSTRAFLASGKVLRSYDIQLESAVQTLFDYANILGRDAVYKQANVLDIYIDETDLLFVDTLHNYDQLRQELARHGDRARKYLVFHDTETFGTRDEIGPGPGLNLAIQQWLDNNHHWRLQQRYTHNNGLTVLSRC